MTRKDLRAAFIVGAKVGLLSQLVIVNFAEKLVIILGASILFIRIGFFLFFLFVAPFLLFLASLIGKWLPIVYQFAKFAAVGSLNSMVDLGIFNLETFLLGRLPTNVTFAVFKSISFLVATTNSFLWNKFWTFESKGKIQVKEAVKFYSIAVSGGVINVSAATFVSNFLPNSVSADFWVNIVSPLAGIFAALIWDFLGYKFFVFKREQSKSENGKIESF